MRADDELALGAEPDAASTARRFVTGLLAAAPAALVDDAHLIVTELVTNAQLHGAAPILVRATWDEPRVRVEVQDLGSHMLVLPARSNEAMTGRGLSLVAALSSRWGVSAAQDGGKVVWSELHEGDDGTGTAELDLDALLSAWPGDEPQEPEFTVRLGSVPTELLLDAKRHIDNVVRELTLERAGSSSLAPGFEALIETVTNGFAIARAAIKRQAVAAAARGDEETELVLRLPASAAAAGERYLLALDEADQYSRAARLLTLETPPLHRVFRGWYVQSIVTQLRARAAGQEPPRGRTFVEVLSDEVSALSALRQTADRLRLLQRVNSDLTGAVSEQDIAAVVVRHAAESLGALSARVFLADGDVLRSLHHYGGERRWVEQYETLPIDADLPGAQVFRTGEPVLLRSLAQMTALFPGLAQVFPTERVLHVVPLVVGDHRLGFLSLSFPPRGDLDEDTQSRFVRALADALAQALERARALHDAAAAAARLSFLARASVALSASLDVDQTIDAITGVMVPQLADWCSLSLVEDGVLVPVGIRHVDPEKVEWAWEVSRRYPPNPDAPAGAPQVLRTGTSEVYPDISDDLLAASAVDEEQLRLLRGVGMRSGMAVALPGRHGIIGVLTLIYTDEAGHRRYSAADVEYVEDVARRAALALETARVLRDQSGRLEEVTRVADAAQKAILAAPPARLGPVALAARYTSAAAEALIGGDLYETVARQGAVRLLIGDVRGKGLPAVRTATIVLGEFRAAAADVDDLAEVARQVDRRLRAYLGDEDFVTALLAEVLDDGRYAIAACGHPPALLASSGSIVALHSTPTLPLGLGADPEVLTGQLAVGDRLLLYTDGVLEARDPDREFVDLMHLVRPLSAGALEQVLDDILDHLHGMVGGDLGDDLALLVAEYTG